MYDRQYILQHILDIFLNCIKKLFMNKTLKFDQNIFFMNPKGHFGTICNMVSHDVSIGSRSQTGM